MARKQDKNKIAEQAKAQNPGEAFLKKFLRAKVSCKNEKQQQDADQYKNLRFRNLLPGQGCGAENRPGIPFQSR